MLSAKRDGRSVLARKAEEFDIEGGDFAFSTTHHHHHNHNGAFPVLSLPTNPTQVDHKGAKFTGLVASAAAATAATTAITATTITTPPSPVAVYRQYIDDRVSGNSYIPLAKRRPRRQRPPGHRGRGGKRVGASRANKRPTTTYEMEQAQQHSHNMTSSHNHHNHHNQHPHPQEEQPPPHDHELSVDGSASTNEKIQKMFQEDTEDNEEEGDHEVEEDEVDAIPQLPMMFEPYRVLDDDNDPTDCRNRPPHFLCFVPPCVRRCPGCLEQNACCQAVGQIGCHSYFKNHHLARRRLFSIGFAFNLVALGLTVVASLAFSRHYTLLTKTSFSRGVISVPQWGNHTTATINIGFRAVALTDPDQIVGGNMVSMFQEFCNVDDDENADDENDDDGDDLLVQQQQQQPPDSVRRFLSQDLCGDCKDSSQQFVLSCVVNIILILRNMFSDITRMYPKYDLNCPNFYGSLMATLSVFLGLYTIATYQNRCFQNAEEELRPFYRQNFTAVTGSDQFNHQQEQEELDDLILVRFVWSKGPGLDCLMAATLLRFVDAICNFIVPTPTITRNRLEQEQYELEFGESSSPTTLPIMRKHESEYYDKDDHVNDNDNDKDNDKDNDNDDWMNGVGDEDGLQFGTFPRLPPTSSLNRVAASPHSNTTTEEGLVVDNGGAAAATHAWAGSSDHREGGGGAEGAFAMVDDYDDHANYTIDDDDDDHDDHDSSSSSSSGDENAQDRGGEQSIFPSFHQIRPPWDRRGLPPIREESFSHDLSLENLRHSIGSKQSFGSF
ncbi:hypothetical protein ACA910_005598 [Epithemia clementina (nom. ined.)]